MDQRRERQGKDIGYTFDCHLFLWFVLVLLLWFVLVLLLVAIQVEPRPDVTSVSEVNIDGNLHSLLNVMQPDEGHVETLSRVKRRADDRKVHRGKNGGKRNKNKSRDQNQISAVHIVVNKHHPLVVGKQLKTGERGSLIAYWKFADNDFSKLQRIADLGNDGTLTIKRSGLYMIYSQMTYFDRTGRWSHLVAVNEKPFIKCLASEWGIESDPDTQVLYNTIHQCYTSAVIALNKGDRVGIYSMYPDRVMHEDKEMCFWGLIKLA